MTTTFADLGVPPKIADHLASRGITEPFPIQEASIPDGLDGLDICGRAPTGSGKTLAFGIPMVVEIEKGTSLRPKGLVLAPTRELAEQIRTELEPLARIAKRRVLSVYGGVGYEPQRRALHKGVDILIACPGRLADLIQHGDADLRDVNYVVIDEADRMADMGFLPEVKKLLDQTSNQRQTVLFSATLDGAVKAITRDYQLDPVRHEVGPARPDITSMRHLFWQAERNERVALTARAVRALGPTIVFTRTRHGADRLAKQLGRAGVDAVPIHGGRSQGQRTRALAAFANYDAEALVATDVAARGIHVDEVAGVIHFDPPEDASTYVHRSGRTARAGATGVVISLVNKGQNKDVKGMQRALKIDSAITPPGDLAGFDTVTLTPKSPTVQSGQDGGNRNGGGNRSGGNRGGGRNGGGKSRQSGKSRNRNGAPRGKGKAGAKRSGGGHHGDSERSESGDRRSTGKGSNGRGSGGAQGGGRKKRGPKSSDGRPGQKSRNSRNGNARGAGGNSRGTGGKGGGPKGRGGQGAGGKGGGPKGSGSKNRGGQRRRAASSSR